MATSLDHAAKPVQHGTLKLRAGRFDPRPTQHHYSLTRCPPTPTRSSCICSMPGHRGGAGRDLARGGGAAGEVPRHLCGGVVGAPRPHRLRASRADRTFRYPGEGRDLPSWALAAVFERQRS